LALVFGGVAFTWNFLNTAGNTYILWINRQQQVRSRVYWGEEGGRAAGLGRGWGRGRGRDAEGHVGLGTQAAAGEGQQNGRRQGMGW
jgi:hypothetical protein